MHFPTGLRPRLMLLVVLALFPAFGLIAWNTISEREHAAQRAERDALNTARAAGREQRRLISEINQLLMGLAKLPEVRSPRTAAACNKTLAEVQKSYPFYTNIGVVTMDGDMFCNSKKMPGPVNILDRAYFQRAVENNAFGVGDYQVGRVTGVNSINFGFPVRDANGRSLAIIFAGLHLGWINQLIADNSLPESSTITIVDSKGSVLAHSPDSKKWVGKSIVDTKLWRLIQELQKQDLTEGMSETEGVGDQPYLYAFAPLHDIPSGRVFVAVGIPREVAYAAANKGLLRNVTWLALVTIFAMIAAWWGGNFFVLRRVRALSDAATRLGKGDLKARTGMPDTNDELGRLSSIFNYMANGLELMTGALHRVNRALKALSASNRATARATTEQELFDEVTRVFVEEGGYRCAWICNAIHDEKRSVIPVSVSGFPGGLEAFNRFIGEITWADTERGRSLSGTAIRTLKPCYIKNILNDANQAPWQEGAVRHGFASGIAFPLTINGKAIGALCIFSEDKNAFDAEELTLLTEASRDLANGIAVLRARNKHDQALEQLAFYDSNTGIPNYAYFERRLRLELPEAMRHGRQYALLMIDLIRLREINDALGFHQGDILLKEVAARVRSVLRSDTLFARMRGDDFGVLLPIKDPQDAANTSKKIINILNQSYSIGNINVNMNSVVGISLFPEHGNEMIQLVRHADVAMKQAKQQSENYAFYSAQNDKDSPERLVMISGLREAIENEQLVLHFQSKMNMRTGRICGAEALVRWNDPNRGMIRPDEFIPLAEHSGLIKPLTGWVISAALKQSAMWRKTGINIPIAVNLSGRNLHDAELFKNIQQACSAHGAKSNWLEFEITESVVMEDPKTALTILTRLKEMGIPLYIDDFGAGYSSLAYLKRLPVSAVKIDKSFVIDMLSDNNSAKIVASTINLAHELDLLCVAEGIENKEMWDQLYNQGCDIAQGFFISRPVTGDAFRENFLNFSQPKQKF